MVRKLYIFLATVGIFNIKSSNDFKDRDKILMIPIERDITFYRDANKEFNSYPLYYYIRNDYVEKDFIIFLSREDRKDMNFVVDEKRSGHVTDWRFPYEADDEIKEKAKNFDEKIKENFTIRGTEIRLKFLRDLDSKTFEFNVYPLLTIKKDGQDVAFITEPIKNSKINITIKKKINTDIVKDDNTIVDDNNVAKEEAVNNNEPEIKDEDIKEENINNLSQDKKEDMLPKKTEEVDDKNVELEKEDFNDNKNEADNKMNESVTKPEEMNLKETMSAKESRLSFDKKIINKEEKDMEKNKSIYSENDFDGKSFINEEEMNYDDKGNILNSKINVDENKDICDEKIKREDNLFEFNNQIEDVKEDKKEKEIFENKRNEDQNDIIKERISNSIAVDEYGYDENGVIKREVVVGTGHSNNNLCCGCC